MLLFYPHSFLDINMTVRILERKLHNLTLRKNRAVSDDDVLLSLQAEIQLNGNLRGNRLIKMDTLKVKSTTHILVVAPLSLYFICISTVQIGVIYSLFWLYSKKIYS